MNNLIQESILTQKFVTEFRCIGTECEDDCCHGWGVPIEKQTFLNLRKLYQNIGHEKNRFSNALKRSKKSKDDNYYGRLNIKRGHPCPFLNPDGLCDIQQRFGHERLGRTCKEYPRAITKNYTQIEITIGISCPEAARLCLLKPGSTELVKADQNILMGSSGFVRDLPNDANQEPYVQLRNEIRQIMLMLADAHQYDTYGRLYLLLHFAHRAGAFFHLNSTCFSIDKLSREIEHIADPSVHSRLVNEFHEQPYDPTLAISMIYVLLTFRADYPSEFTEFVQSCVGRHQNSVDKGLNEENSEGLAELIRPYFERKEQIERLYKESIDQYFDNYINYYLFRSWYFKYPTLISYIRNLLIQIHIIKFLFFLNPLLDPVLQLTEKSDQKTINDHKELLDKAIVQVCYQCARGFEHFSPMLLDVMSQALDEEGMTDIKQLSQLAKC